ncbi:MAG: tyrosine-protein phosphatase [Pseudobdellovibrionaceae bacterium]
MTTPEENAKLRPITKTILIKTISFILFTAGLLWVWQSSIVRLSKNFHEVDPGKFYRSAQLTPAELEEAIQKYGIKTVISLRGAPENSYWVPKQKEVLAKHNVKFYWFGWTTDFFPDNDDLKGYLMTLKTAEYPVLVHCRTGADRTGEAVAMYAIDQMNQSKEEAIAKNLNFKYWHVPAFHPAKTEFVRQYKGINETLATYDLCSPEHKAWVEPGHCAKM